MMVFAFALALASPPPFEPIDQVDSYQGCVIKLGKPDPVSKVQPLRAECHWADVTVASVHRVVTNYERSGDFIDCMKDVNVVRVEGGRTLVWQLDRLGWGLDPRESEVWMHDGTIAGGCQITWTKADEAFTLQPGSVLMPANSGSWWVTAGSDGGVDIVQDLMINPGGSLPSWVVNWFQTFGLSDELKRLHALTASV